jgi:predicted dehydrogenase
MHSSRRDFLKVTGQSFLAAGVLGSSEATAMFARQPDATVQKKTGWAIVGLGKLALDQVMPAFAKCQRCRPTALVSGHADKAAKVAEQYGIESKHIYNYENYDKLKDDPDVDVVYIILPNSMHAEYTIRAHKAGKHVLCEKPMCVTVDEAQRMIDAAKEASRKLMIAYRLRYEPFNQKAIELSRQKAYGPIRFFEAVNYQNQQAPNYRLQKALGGGPLGDVGVYCLNAARYITGEEPVEANGMIYQPADDPRFKEVPGRVAFQLRFPSGAIASCGCGFDGAGARSYRAVGAEGWLEMENAFGYAGQQLRVRKGRDTQEPKLQPLNHFAAEMDYFADCVLNDKQPLTPGEEGLKDMKVMAAIEESVQTGKTVKIS